MSDLPTARVVERGTARYLGPAPRRIGLLLWLQLVFGPFTCVFGWLWLAATGVAWSQYTGFEWRHHFDRTADAIVDRVVVTHDMEGDESGVRVHYHFTDESGHAIHGIAHGKKHRSVEGHQIAEYDSHAPHASRLRSFGSSFHTWGSLLFVLLLEVPGLILLVAAGHGTRRALRLLRFGRTTTGKLVGKEITGSGSSEKIELTFRYDADGRKLDLVIAPENPSELEDEAAEPMVYDPDWPERAVMLDDLPGRPRVVDGQLRGRKLRWSALIALLAATTFAAEVVRLVWLGLTT